MMGTFTATPGLDEFVAKMVAPEVRDVAEKVGDATRRAAPATKRWVTMADELVRHTHVATHGQEVPENLRFEVPSMEWDMIHRGLGPITYMMKPLDESSGAIANIGSPPNCRCVTALNPAAIAEKIRVSESEVIGPKVTVRVYCEAYKIVECEFGDTYDRGNRSPGTRFMSKAAAAFARSHGTR